MSTVDQVMQRIACLGVVAKEQRAAYFLQLAKEKLLANLGTQDVPEALSFTWTEMAAGLYLVEERSLMQDAQAPEIKEVTEGDIRVSYQGAVTELNALLLRMCNPPDDILTAYRKVRW